VDRVENLEKLEEEHAVNVVEIAGFVKWFDVARGYGFLIPENGLPDILIHLSCLKRDGFDAVLEGTRIVCEAVERQKGLQALKILSVDASTAIQPVQRPSRTHVEVQPDSDWIEVTVKWFNRVRGYGFASEGPGGPDIFIHMETLRKYAIAEVYPEQKLFVRFGQGPKGLMAAEIKLTPEGHLPQPN
jgi:CspA family cold shock protein